MSDSDRNTEQAPEPTEQAPEPVGWPPWYRWGLGIGLTLAFLLGLAGTIGGTNTLPAEAMIVGGLAVAVFIVLLVFVGGGGRPRFVLMADVLLDIAALVAAATTAMGLAWAILLPLIGLILVLDTVRGRPLVAAFAGAFVTSIASMVIAFLVGPTSSVPKMGPAIFTLGTASLATAYAFIYLWLANSRRARALDTARTELATRRASEAELARTSRVLSAILRTSPVPTVVLDEDGRVSLWNMAAERVFGWSSKEVVGSPPPADMAPDGEPGPAAVIEAALEAGSYSGQRVAWRTKDGHPVWVDIYVAPLIDEEGERLGIAAQLADVTDRVSLDNRLAQAAKMESIGVLAGGIAHDFNNMLTAIRGHAELAQIELGQGPAFDQAAAQANVTEAVQAADRAAELTRQMLAFARRAAIEPRILSPGEVLTAFQPMLGRLLGEHIVLEMDLSPDTGLVRMDQTQLEQVILNLAVNARDAMPDGGRLTISTSSVVLDKRRAAAHPGGKPGPYVRLTVEDTGKGMDEATLQRAFEPFFTTKEPGKGTGMGLATVFGIAATAGAFVDVTSKVGSGTTFTIFFPRVEEEATEVEAAERRNVPGGGETILVVEDDASVRSFATRCLTGLGYTVVQASSGAEALRLARADQAIDLLLSDVVMPGMQGPELARRLSKKRPGLRTLFCSGFIADGDLGPQARRAAGRTAPGSGGAYLAKPYSRETLSRAVRAVLDADVEAEASAGAGRLHG